MVTARGARRKALRQQLFDLTGGRCEWESCGQAATQMAHAHSIGLGGRASADTIDNVASLCDPHSLVSDGLVPGHLGRDWYLQQLALLGVDVWDWNAAEALKAHIARNRPKTVPS